MQIEPNPFAAPALTEPSGKTTEVRKPFPSFHVGHILVFFLAMFPLSPIALYHCLNPGLKMPLTWMFRFCFGPIFATDSRSLFEPVTLTFILIAGTPITLIALFGWRWPARSWTTECFRLILWGCGWWWWNFFGVYMAILSFAAAA